VLKDPDAMNSPADPNESARSKTPAVGAGSAQPQEDFKKRLTDEYKILQDRIDKIGGFRFTIKGWSVTAVIAASVAGSNTTNLAAVITISVGLAVMVLFFFRFELEQVRLSRLFGDRARRLEDAFVRIDRGRWKSSQLLFPVPYTANDIALDAYRRRIRRRRSLHLGTRKYLANKLVGLWHVWRQAHIWFYAVLFFLAFAPLVLHVIDSGSAPKTTTPAKQTSPAVQPSDRKKATNPNVGSK
jgi:hypothetical protein